MEEKLIPAPIDDKNVMTDWIEEMFDDGSCITDYNHNRIIGFIEQCPVLVKWYRNRIEWKFVDRDNDNSKGVDSLWKKLEKKAKANPELIQDPSVIGDGIAQNFYWRDE